MSAIHVIIQYVDDPRPQRRAEYDECVRRNLAHPAVAAVHHLPDGKSNVPPEFRDHPKFKEHPLGKWMTYKNAIDFANANLRRREPVRAIKESLTCRLSDNDRTTL